MDYMCIGSIYCDYINVKRKYNFFLTDSRSRSIVCKRFYVSTYMMRLMMKRIATIYDVAEAAGVSIATVSRVLNAPSRVSLLSKQKVLAAMEELDFVPKADAVARARRDFRRIGVIVPFLTSPSFVQRIRGITGALASTEYELVIYSIETQEQLQDYYISLPVSRKVDGLIILALPVHDDDAARFKEFGMPVVLVEIENSQLSGIQIDNERGGTMAADHLLTKGYRDLGFIGEGGQPAYSLHATDERFYGFRKEIEKQGGVFREENAIFHDYGMDKTVDASKKLLSGPKPPRALFAASDLEAVGVLTAARELGLRVPEDVAVIGFDDIDLAGYMGITTINQSLDESGRTAATLLLEKMKSPGRTARNIMLSLKIVERFTT